MNTNKKRLGDIASFINGRAFKPSEWSKKGLPIIRIQNLNDLNAPLNYFDGEIENRYIVRKGDILISWSASLGVFEWYGSDAVLNQHIFKVVFDKLDVDRKYFKYIVSEVINEMIRYTHGSTMKHIVKKDFDNTKIYIPPLSDQQRIANILDHADAIRRKNREIFEKYNQLAQSVFLEMFGDPIKNNKKWNSTYLYKLGKLISGGTPTRNRSEYFTGDIPWITTTALGKNFIDKDDANELITDEAIKNSATKLIPKGSIMIGARVGVGKASILSCDMCGSQDILSITEVSPEVNSMYLLGVLKRYEQYFLSQKRGVTIQGITSSTIKNILVPLPMIDLQNTYSRIILGIDRNKNLSHNSLKKNEELFLSLLQRAFRGEL